MCLKCGFWWPANTWVFCSYLDWITWSGTGLSWLTGNIAFIRWPLIHTLICTWCPQLVRLPSALWFKAEQEQSLFSAAAGKHGSDLCDASPAFHASCCSVVLAPPTAHLSSSHSDLGSTVRLFIRFSRVQMPLNICLMNKNWAFWTQLCSPVAL